MKKGLIGLIIAALMCTVIIWWLPRGTHREKNESGALSPPAVETQLVTAVPKVPQAGSPNGLPQVGAVTKTPAAPAEPKLSVLEEVIRSAPEEIRNRITKEGIPPLPLGTNDPYREVTFVNPNGGPPTVRKAHSVEPVIDDEGKTNAFAIRYMKGQRPFTNANDGRILVGPVVNPGGDK